MCAKKEDSAEYGKREAYLKWGNPAQPESKTYSWTKLAEYLGQPLGKVRSAARYYRSKHLEEFEKLSLPELVALEGVDAEGHEPDEDEVYERAVQDYENTRLLYEKKRSQRIVFDSGPIALVWAADHHFGDPGVDVERAFTEAQLIADTPGMYLGLGGDMINNFILQTLRHARDNARMGIRDEWALLRKYLRITLPKHLFSIPGNHLGWSHLLTGIDYFAELLKELDDHSLYDMDEVVFTLQVGDWEIPCKARHKWRGNSIYNVTHAIERASLREGDFLLGFGAHNHTGGFTRTINVNGENGMAVQAGSYKRIDSYAIEKGFDKPNQSTAVAVIIHDHQRSFVGYDNLDVCANDLMAYYE
jgi:hypothetical protein